MNPHEFKSLTDFDTGGERALTFGVGLLITLGTLVYVLYTASGLALLPVTLIRSAPAVSAPKLAATTQSELDQNRERQRQLEARNEGRPNGPGKTSTTRQRIVMIILIIVSQQTLVTEASLKLWLETNVHLFVVRGLQRKPEEKVDIS